MGYTNPLLKRREVGKLMAVEVIDANKGRAKVKMDKKVTSYAEVPFGMPNRIGVSRTGITVTKRAAGESLGMPTEFYVPQGTRRKQAEALIRDSLRPHGITRITFLWKPPVMYEK